jgi:TetR/AcrR family transcriptional regulator, cholesterol catabolism regulator
MEAKERILLRAHDLFNKYGLRSVSMDDIAAQLGMSKKTLYQYYTDKDELVDAVFVTTMDQNQTACRLDRQRAENPIHEVFLAYDMVQEMFANMNPSVLFELHKYHPGTYKKFQEYKNGFLYQMIRTNIETGIREELYREDVDVDVLTRFRIHSIMLGFDPEVFPSNRSRLVHIEQQLLENFMYGLATAKGVKLIQKYKNQRTKNKFDEKRIS